jgi:hypothetical protein
MICKNSANGQDVCVDFEPSFNLLEARDAYQAANETLGQAASLLVRDGGGYAVPLRPDPLQRPADQWDPEHKPEPIIGVQPPVSDSPAPYFEFSDADCQECGEGDDCTVSQSRNNPSFLSSLRCPLLFAAHRLTRLQDCDWQFRCGMKKKCFYNGARNVVQLCYELGQKCHV